MATKTHSPTRPARRMKFLLLTAGLLAAAGHASAQVHSFQFSQVFPDGGQVDGFVVGEDLDGDGRLYSMASFIGDFLDLPPGDEVSYVSLHFRNFDGRSFTQVYDRSEVGIDDPANSFFALAYNLNGGAFGDDANEGMFLGPLAPSTSYIMGPLLAPAQAAVSDDGFSFCGNPDGLPCAAVTSLEPREPFPAFEIVFNAFGSAAVPTTTRLRFTFRQTGFEGGGVVSGVLAGEDLDRDGRLYTMSAFAGGFFDLPAGDEVSYVFTQIDGFNGSSFGQGADRSQLAASDPGLAFLWAGYNLAGRFWGDELDEGFNYGPLAPSTTYSIGRLIPFETGLNIADIDFGACSSSGDVACSMVYSLTPSEPFPSVDVTFAEASGGRIEMVPAPLVADDQFTGSWYAPTHSGEGFVIESLADGRTGVSWYTYDTEGNQRWFIGIARREGMALIVEELVVTQGGQFGPMFDPAQVNRTVAGSLRIDFDSCSSGLASYVVDDVEGSQNLVRLTLTKGLACRDQQSATLVGSQAR